MLRARQGALYSMSQNFEKMFEQAAAFQKIWMESMSRMLQAGFTFTPGSPPPEAMRQVRSGIFQAMTESWEQFMRSPQFTEGIKPWMDNTIAARKMSNDLMAKLRNEMQAPSRDDIDTVMLTVRHMEKRLLDRMDALSEEVAALNRRLDEKAPNPRRPRRRAGRAAERPTSNGKETLS